MFPSSFGRVTVFSLLVVACGSASPPSVPAPEATRSDLNPPVVRLRPTGELRETVADEAMRWELASGRRIEIAGLGIPVSYADVPSCGRTVTRWEAPFVVELLFRRDRSGCRDIEDSIRHELGHVLCLSGDELVADGCHTGSGLMQGEPYASSSDPDARDIDGVSLAAVGVGAACPAFKPED